MHVTYVNSMVAMATALYYYIPCGAKLIIINVSENVAILRLIIHWDLLVLSMVGLPLCYGCWTLYLYMYIGNIWNILDCRNYQLCDLLNIKCMTWPVEVAVALKAPGKLEIGKKLFLSCNTCFCYFVMSYLLFTYEELHILPMQSLM